MATAPSGHFAAATPGQALVESPIALRAAAVLRKLLEADHGEAHVRGLAERICSFLEWQLPGRIMQRMGLKVGTPKPVEVDWDHLLGGREAWVAAGLVYEEALVALRSLADLVTVGNRRAEPVEVRSCDGLHIEGTWQGQPVSFELQRCQQPESWGRWSCYVASDRGSPLHGCRVVMHLRDGTPHEESVFQPQTGDTLCFAPDDRAAYLEVVHYDRLPERVMRIPGIRGADEAAEELFHEARDFNRQLASCTRAHHRTWRRFERLVASPVVNEVLKRCMADLDTWGPILRAGEPYALRLYEAAAKASGGMDLAVEVDVGAFRRQLCASVVGVALACIHEEAGHQHEQVVRSQLPLYTLRGEQVLGDELGESTGSDPQL